MCFKIILLCWLVLSCGLNIKKTTIPEHTALITYRYSADPSAHVFEGKIYIYASHDQSGETACTDPVDKFDMVDYKVFSIDASS